MDTKEFIKQAIEIHGDKYNYHKTEYVDSKTKVCIICPKHGEFWQTPKSHLNGCGCSACVGLKKPSTEEYIDYVKKVHNNKYDYSKTVYINKNTKITIICPIHGEFQQRAHNHKRGQGCPECGKQYAVEWRQGDYKSFIEESNQRFPGMYSFPMIEQLYLNSHSKIKIKCNKCGNEFTKIACDHLTSSYGGCGKCNCQTSKKEEELYEIIKSILPNTEINSRCRNIIDNKEIDIYIPSLKIGIEYNGLFWHSSARKNKYYHLEKLEQCNKNGIKLIQIFEDEYVNKKDIVISKLKHILNINDNKTKVMARKCIIKEINNTTARNFLEENHIQGFSSSTVYLGAFFNELLIGVMTFKKESKNDDKWELTRFATLNNIICSGMGGKLFKHFVRKNNPTEVKSFADRRWTTDKNNNLYIKIGFKLEKILKPDYRYMQNSKYVRMHKFNFRKQILHKKYGLPLTMTETEMCEKIGAYRIYDCGLLKYVWKNLDN